MKWPHWLTHHWGKYGTPYSRSYDFYDCYGNYSHSTKRTYQKRVCETCGMEGETLVNTDTYYK
jgi:hypothetical protein